MKTKTTLKLLDGYRGFLANVVVLHHMAQLINRGDIGLFRELGYFVGVSGFFVLSSFLLTTRLIIDFSNAQSLVIYVIRVVQYLIRRFFRIYLVFIAF
jgi:peptidoglycan/LPS O-acetylase OafA/YrhL